MTHFTTKHPKKGIKFPVDLTMDMEKKAERLAKYHKKTGKYKERLVKAKATLAAQFYCDFLNLEANLNTDSWNPAIQLFFDVADLNIKNLGKLECRPVLPGQNYVHIPSEVWEDRIAYLVVQINEEEKEAKILGFVRKADKEEIPLDELEPLEDFIDYVYELKDKLVPVEEKISREVWRSLGTNLLKLMGTTLLEEAKKFEQLMIDFAYIKNVELASPRDLRKEEFVEEKNITREDKIQEHIAHMHAAFFPEESSVINNSAKNAWDILFFAGHSTPVENKGYISLNHNEDEAIADLLIKLLEVKSNDNSFLCQIVNALGDFGLGHKKAINALNEILDVTEYPPLRWQAAISLAKLDPDNPRASCVKFNKVIKLKELKVLLTIATLPLKEEKTSVFVMVTPAEKQASMPEDFKVFLAEIDESSTESEEKEINGTDVARVRKPFKLPVGGRLQVRLTMNEITIIENVTV